MPQSRYFRPVYMPRPRLPYRPAASRAGVASLIPSTDALIKGFGAAVQQQKAKEALQQQNDIANRLMNTSNPLLGTTAPRAAYVPGVNAAQRAADALRVGVSPATVNVLKPGVPTQGTAPITGGLNEIAVRQELIKQAMAEAQLRNTVIGGGKGGGGGGRQVLGGQGSRWEQYLGGQGGGGDGSGAKGAAKAAKPPPYVPFQQYQNDPNSDNFNLLEKDFNSQFGKGAYSKVAPNIGNLTKNDDGSYSLLDKKGDKAFTIQAQDLPYWQNRLNANRISTDQNTVGPLPDGINPKSGQPAGSQVNPIAPTDDSALRALPYGTWIQTPDGKVQQKIKPAAAVKGQTSTDQTGAPAQDNTALTLNAPSQAGANTPDYTGVDQSAQDRTALALNMPPASPDQAQTTQGPQFVAGDRFALPPQPQGGTSDPSEAIRQANVAQNAANQSGADQQTIADAIARARLENPNIGVGPYPQNSGTYA